MQTRRSFLKQAAWFGAGVAFAPRLFAYSTQAQSGQPAQPAAPAPDRLQQFRTAGATTPIQVTKLRDTLFLLQGVGGNMVAQTGPDGKVLIDSSAATAASRLKDTLRQLAPHPMKLLINTHWHFDHTDGNAALHDDMGAFIMAQENTRNRLATAQEIAFFHLKLQPSPTSALPQQTFIDKEKIFINNDELDLVNMPDAHTDTDIYIHFAGGNVLHCGDVFFNGVYPFIDASTGGTINGMIRGADACLAVADDKTKIVPGHGPLGDKDALQKYRDMLAAIATKVEKLKSSGQSLDQVIAAKPTSDFDAAWGKGSLKPDQFVELVYSTL
ncbi:MBL fold metallo-hydrolase [Alloacidobacterium dinghuense]|uniref:MBL fold metallo-hydrolase n=1 Tax=Alloacidobacterium dinghuense TaxID=2763107 RepID=A0A7G8BKG0_9BACT|nr:MBL fold metallo-hydrolase [Alloacidobacterium dinghuense]QNI33030.1 MBL fold metallo-hydrolase [Alloacidobacterium dinghuense]